MIRSALVIAGFLILTLAAHATPVGLGTAAGYNVFTFGDFSSTSDIAGRVAVGGYLKSNITVGANGEYQRFPSAGVFTDLAHGNGKYTVTENNGGNVYVPSYTSSNGHIQIQNGPGAIITGSNPLDFISAKSSLLTLSLNLSSLKASTTGTMKMDNGRYVLTANSAVSIFNLSADEFNKLKAINTKGNTVIVNVSGKSITYDSGNNFTVDGVQATAGSYAASKVLFNFKAASTIDLYGGLYGTILAPQATLTGNSQLNGQFIVNNLNYQGQIHGTAFSGTIPTPTPEPGTMVLLGSGVAGLWALKKKVLPR